MIDRELMVLHLLLPMCHESRQHFVSLYYQSQGQEHGGKHSRFHKVDLVRKFLPCQMACMEQFGHSDWACALHLILPDHSKGHKVYTRGARAEAMCAVAMDSEVGACIPEMGAAAAMIKMMRMALAVHRLSNLLGHACGNDQFASFRTVTAVHEEMISKRLTKIPLQGEEPAGRWRCQPSAHPLPVGPPQPPTSQSTWHADPGSMPVVGCPQHSTCQSNTASTPWSFACWASTASNVSVHMACRPWNYACWPTCQSTRHPRPWSFACWASTASNVSVHMACRPWNYACWVPTAPNVSVNTASRPGALPVGPPQYAKNQLASDLSTQDAPLVDPQCRSTWTIDIPVRFMKRARMSFVDVPPEQAEAPDPANIVWPTFAKGI